MFRNATQGGIEPYSLASNVPYNRCTSSIESSYQPPTLFLAIAVIQIYLEAVSLCISNQKVAAVSPRIPLTAAARKAAEPGIDTFIQHLCYIMDLSAPLETYRVRRLLFLFHLYLLSEEFFHRKINN